MPARNSLGVAEKLDHFHSHFSQQCVLFYHLAIRHSKLPRIPQQRTLSSPNKIQLTTKLALYGCIAYSIDVACSYCFLPSIWKKLKWTKILCCALSWVFSLAFGLLYYVGDCSGISSVFLKRNDQRAFCRWTSASCGPPRTTASRCRTARTRRVASRAAAEA